MKLITATSWSDNAATGGEPSLPVRAALLLLRTYKLLVSPYFAGSCRFLPSCADYAAEAMMVHGLLAGSWLAASRLARCHPFCEAGHDPVPRKTVGQ